MKHLREADQAPRPQSAAMKLCLEKEHVSYQTSHSIMSEFQDRKPEANAFTSGEQAGCAGSSKTTERRSGWVILLEKCCSQPAASAFGNAGMQC
jgi:hypothetical protein